jgi:hypothetical protein
MTIQFPTVQGREAVDLLAATEEFYREIAEEVVLALRDAREGNPGSAKATGQAVRELRAAFGIVMDERTRVAKLREKAAGCIGSGVFDFDAARDEIGRRLACLRDAGGGG